MLSKRPMPELDGLLVGSSIMLRVSAVAFVLLLATCHKAHAADHTNLIPDILFEAEHMSHMTQHAPFTSNPTRYGANLVNLGLVWAYGPMRFTLAEGIDLSPHYAAIPSYGELIGRSREEFSARLSYTLSFKR